MKEINPIQVIGPGTCNPPMKDAEVSAADSSAHVIRRKHAITILRNLVDAIEDTELHGGGAHDDSCPICIYIQDAKKLLGT